MKLGWTSAGGVAAAAFACAALVGLAGRPVEAEARDARSTSASPARAPAGPRPLSGSGLLCCVAATGACELAVELCTPERIMVWCDPGERPLMVETGVWLCEPQAAPSSPST